MGRRFFRNKSAHSDEPGVNLTPLIDVVFTILIMFIVIAPLLEIDRIDLADANPEAKDGTTTVKESGPIAIQVHQDNTVWLNQKQVDLADLASLLKEEKAKHPLACPKI